MKTKFIFGVLGTVIGFTLGTFFLPLLLKTVSVDDIYCQIDDFEEAGSQVEVPLTTYNGRNTEQVPPLAVGFGDVSATVVYEQGDAYETQTYLSMAIWNGTSTVTSTLYDYVPEWKSSPINVIYYRDDGETIRLQCAFRK